MESVLANIVCPIPLLVPLTCMQWPVRVLDTSPMTERTEGERTRTCHEPGDSKLTMSMFGGRERSKAICRRHCSLGNGQ